MKRFLFALLPAVLVISPLFSQEDDFTAGMFEDDVVEEETDSGENLSDDLLENDGGIIGGRFYLSVKDEVELFDTDTNMASLDFYSDVFLDARPSTEFRVFAKATIEYPFDFTGTDTAGTPDLRHKELFADYSLYDRINIRAGKHTVTWGVGYFFSPADVISLTTIDPKNPEEEQTGPVSVKANIPLDVHNVYTYIVLDELARNGYPVIAPRAEFVAGPAEFGIGAAYQYDNPVYAMVTVSTSLFNVNFFGEGMVQYGADRNFVEETDVTMENPLGLEVVTYDDKYFVSATAGFSTFEDDITDFFGVSAAGQYFYNGIGYDNVDVLRDNQAALGIFFQNGDLNPSDLRYAGKHYSAVNLSLTDLFETDFGLSGFWLAGWSAITGSVTGTVTWAPSDYAAVDVYYRFAYGDEFSEFAPEGDKHTAGVKFRLAYGSY